MRLIVALVVLMALVASAPLAWAISSAHHGSNAGPATAAKAKSNGSKAGGKCKPPKGAKGKSKGANGKGMASASTAKKSKGEGKANCKKKKGKTKKKPKPKAPKCSGATVCLSVSQGIQQQQITVSGPACGRIASATFVDPADHVSFPASGVRVGGKPPRCTYKLQVPYQFCIRARQFKQGKSPTEYELLVYLGASSKPAKFKLSCKKRKLKLAISAAPVSVPVGESAAITVTLIEPGSKTKQLAKKPKPPFNKEPGSKQPVPGEPVTLRTNLGRLSSTTVTTGPGGTATVTLLATKVGNATVTASVPAVSVEPVAVNVKFTPKCSGAQVTLEDDTNVAAVDNGGAPPVFGTNGKAFCVTYIQTYHWNEEAGFPPGQLGLRLVGGPGVWGVPNVLGPLPAKSSAGQNNAPNVNWYVDVPTSPVAYAMDGTYACTDSSPATWSSNEASAGQGFCIVYGVPAIISIE